MGRTPLKPGEIIQLNNRKYTIEKDIGTGATCIVYSAYYSDSRGHPHHVNIKECYPHNVDIVRQEQKLCWNAAEDKSKSITAFRSAYDKVMLCQNGNFTVHAFDIFENNNTAYIIMDANDGVTFDKDPANSIVDILKTVKLLAHVVGEYHKNGYLHLDIKPSNFLVYPRPSEHIVLFDMDTVTSLENIRLGNISGCSYSDGWAAPEQKQGKINKLCPATDIYAIGAVLFEKIMGRKLNNDDIGYFAEWSFEGDLFEKINPKIKRLLTRIFQKTLAANIKRRYQTAEALVKALEEAIKTAENAVYIKGKDICCSGCFVGREKELNIIKDGFESNKKAVFLHGFGGIGKTEIARKYAEINRNNYDTILFVKYNENDSLKKLISDSLVNYETDDIDDKWCRCCELLDRHCLIIVDNFDVDYKKADELNELFESKACFLISTRTDFSKFYTGEKYLHIEIKQLVKDKLEQVFKNNAQIIDFSEIDREILFKIFVLIENHTYATELLAKQMFYSGWSLEFLYCKVKSGLKNLENSESIFVNKDGKSQEDNSFNILRAVYNISELAEDQKQVLRNLSLLNCVKMTRETYRQITQAESLEPLNKLLKLGLIQNEGENFYLHALIDELVRIEFEPDWDNCIQAYNYVLRMVDEFNYQHIYVMDVPGQEELEFKAEFLSRFFRSVDLLDEANMKLVLRWLNYIFSEENDFWFAYVFHSKIKFNELLPKITDVINKNTISINENGEKFKIWFLLLKIWLKEYRFSYNKVESLTHLCKIREEKLIECFDELLRLSRRIPYGKSLMKDVYIEIALMLESREPSSPLPDYIVRKLYNEKSDVINWNYSDKISNNTNLIFEEYKQFETSSSESNIVTNIIEKSLEEKEWENNLEDLICNFKISSDKLCFAQDVAYDDSYTPSQKIIAISEFVFILFGPLYNNDKEHLESTNWHEVEDIVDLIAELYESNAQYFYDMDDSYWEENVVITDDEFFTYKSILSIILNKGDIDEAIIKLNLCAFNDTFDQYYFRSIINIFALTNKCRYIVPYMVKEFEDRMPEKDSENYADEVRYLYDMIQDIATYSELAAKEVGPEDESYIKFMEVHKMANRMTDMIIDKPFELKEEKEE